MLKREMPPTHPGEILKGLYLEPLEVTVTQAAKNLGVTRNTLSHLLNGHSGISPEMALRLAAALDTTPQLWLNLQQNYDLWQAEHSGRIKGIQRIARPDGNIQPSF